MNETLNGLLEPSGRLDRTRRRALSRAGRHRRRTLPRARPSDVRRALRRRGRQASRAIDLLRVRCTGLDGRPVDRFGYLIVSLGAAATISHRTSQSRSLKKLGEIAYLLMTPP